MRRIEKGSAPDCLAERRREARRVERETGRPPSANDWAPGDCAQPIRDALHRDQRGLCGYCMKSIGRQGHRDAPPPLGNGGMRIEHLEPRSTAPELMYDWENLLGVCGGRSGMPGGEYYTHCDRARRDRPLTIRPTAAVEASLRYARQAPDGEVNDDPGLWLIAPAELQADVDTLHLNNPALRRARRDAEKNVATLLERRHKQGKPMVPFLRQLWQAAATPDGEGCLPAFAPVVQRYVEGKLRAHGA